MVGTWLIFDPSSARQVSDRAKQQARSRKGCALKTPRRHALHCVPKAGRHATRIIRSKHSFLTCPCPIQMGVSKMAGPQNGLFPCRVPFCKTTQKGAHHFEMKHRCNLPGHDSSGPACTKEIESSDFLDAKSPLREAHEGSLRNIASRLQ